VLGPNGAGKSTLLHVMALLLVPDRGEIRFEGEMVDARRDPVPVRRRMAVVFQEPLLFDTTVFANVATGLRLRGVDRAAERARVEVWLGRLGIEHLAGRAARTLSAGEARRASLARALVLEPELLLLDEPFASIDAQTREVMQVELLRICAERDVTALFVTHDITEAAFLGDRVCVFGPRPGRIVNEVTVPFDRPRSQRLRRSPEFLALVDEISDSLYGGTADAAAGTNGETR
jgi:NitT/TauT family transport system ATP-binding protein